jgi:hypothetical protein
MWCRTRPTQAPIEIFEYPLASVRCHGFPSEDGVANMPDPGAGIAVLLALIVSTTVLTGKCHTTAFVSILQLPTARPIRPAPQTFPFNLPKTLAEFHARVNPPIPTGDIRLFICLLLVLQWTHSERKRTAICIAGIHTHLTRPGLAGRSNQPKWWPLDLSHVGLSLLAWFACSSFRLDSLACAGVWICGCSASACIYRPPYPTSPPLVHLKRP